MIVREHVSKPARADQRAAGSRFDSPRAEAVRIEVRIEAMYVAARLGQRHGTAPPEPRNDFGIRIQRRPRFGIVVPPTPQDQTLAPSRYPPVDSSFVPKFAVGRVIGGDTVAIDKRCDPAPHPRPSCREPITLQLIRVRHGIVANPNARSTAAAVTRGSAEHRRQPVVAAFAAASGANATVTRR
ncbi:hypothetical protein WS62_30670 [Burkholderia sp. ABCPW 14]|nr:hypothetical protein WS62_30670 [Burkholderia sp. ABCPW 14]